MNRSHASRPADWLFAAGVIRTLDPDAPVVEALAVAGDRILFAGPAREAEAWRGPNTRVVEIGEGALFPGFIDAHAHVGGLGAALRTVSLAGAAALSQAITRLREGARAIEARAAETGNGGSWLLGRGWDQNGWPERRYPTWRDLEGVTERPAALHRIDGHALWVNRAALEDAGVNAATADPEGGRILRFEDGSPSGVLVDNAMELVLSRIPRPDRGERLARLRTAMEAMARVGLTGATDMGVGEEAIAAFHELAAAGGLLARVELYLSDEPELLDAWFERGPEIGSHHGFLSVIGAKMYSDGALGSRGAALLADYSDEPGNRGLLVTDEDHLAQVARRARAAGFQTAIHAIGDRGNRIAIDALESAARETPTASSRLVTRGRVEHAQVIHPADLPRFAKLGLIASVQPTHATSDMTWAEERLGRERVRGAYAWRSLRNAGARLALGSDFPIESHDPLLGIHAAVTRQDRAGNPPGGWHPEERLTVEEAVGGFTAGAAYAVGQEDRRGTLTAGKYADLVLLSRDLFAVRPEAIPETEVLLTMAGGRVTWRKDQAR